MKLIYWESDKLSLLECVLCGFNYQSFHPSFLWILPGTHIGLATIRIAVKRQTRASIKDWCFRRKPIAGENSLPLNIKVIIVAIFATMPKQVIISWLFSKISLQRGFPESGFSLFNWLVLDVSVPLLKSAKKRKELFITLFFSQIIAYEQISYLF